MPKIKVPAHVMRQYKQDQVARKHKNRELRQAISEHNLKAVAIAKQKQEKQERQKLQERIAERATEDKTSKAEIALLKDESYQFSLSLARQKTQNRIEVLTMDRDYYQKEAAKFRDKDWPTDFLDSTLSDIETELTELQNINHDDNLNHDITE
ncbi:hypothetical protein ES705_24348 [subsurface metagenome]